MYMRLHGTPHKLTILIRITARASLQVQTLEQHRQQQILPLCVAVQPGVIQGTITLIAHSCGTCICT